MRFTELWLKGPKYRNDGSVFPLTTDAILLADFAQAADAHRVLDIGCGSGIIGLLIAWSNPDAQITAVDISEAAVICARENFAKNGLSENFCGICGDILDVSLADRSFDLIVCNPPYFEKGRGKPAGEAREESSATLRDIIRCASRLLRDDGSLCIVIRPDRIDTAVLAMEDFGLSPSRLRSASHMEGSKPSMALIEARSGISKPPEILPPLLLRDESGRDSEEIRRIYRMN